MMSNRKEEQEPKRQGGTTSSSSGLARIWKAFFYSMAGMRAAYLTEAAFRQELWSGLVLVPLALLLPLPLPLRGYLLGCFILVLVVELLNSAIEAVVDKVIPDVDSFAKRAKDMGSGAVFLALLNLALAWGMALVVLYRQQP